MSTTVRGGETLGRAGTGRRCARGGYTLHVEEFGDDVPVLLVHPALASVGTLAGSSRGRIPEAIAARGCRVIAFDLAGHGRSDALPEFPEDYLERSVDDAVAVLESCGIGAVAAAIGIGFGALVALRLAAEEPRRVRCVVADSLPGVLSSSPFEPWNGYAPVPAGDGYGLLPSWLRYTAGLSGSTLPPGFHLGLPTLLLSCGAGNPGEASRMHGLARSLGGAQIAWAPAESPPVCWNAPRFFLREVERFLAVYA